MDKRKEANMLVKERLEEALYSLITEKKLSEITVTELIKKANVARSSFYRNYSSVEDILNASIKKLIDEYYATNPIGIIDVTSYEYFHFKFCFYKTYADRIMTLHKAGLSSITLEVINDIVISECGDMPADSIKRFDLYYYAGAFYNMVIHWLEEGAKESPEDMAKEYCEITLGNRLN